MTAGDPVGQRGSLNDETGLTRPRRGFGAGASLIVAGVLGLILGQWQVMPVVWLALAVACPWAPLVLGWVVRALRKPAWAWWGLLAGVLCVHAGWAGLVMNWQEDAPGIDRFIQGKGHIAQVEGVVSGIPRHAAADDGVFEGFGHRPPTTRLVLDVERVWTESGPVRARGRALVNVTGVDERLAKGQRLEVRGWLLSPTAPMNPGQEDYARSMERYGIKARVQTRGEGNVKVLAGGADAPEAMGWRGRLRSRADDALMMGIDPEEPSGRLTRALIIGTRDDRLYEISEPYRKTGLFHLLSISGAHLSILLGLVWLMGRACFANPASTVWLVLGVLGCYLVVLPQEVPIIRASLMVLGLCLGDLMGRRLGATLGLLASAWVILLVRPQEVMGVGFQLSYVGVMSLMWLTGPVDELLSACVSRVTWRSQWRATTGTGHVVLAAGRWGRLWVAANLAAWLGTLPILAFEFGTVNPIGWLWSLISAPVVTALLALGFIKMVLGLAVPGVSMVFATPVEWLAGVLHAGVTWAGEMPGASFAFAPGARPDAVWLIGAAGVLVALGWGKFQARPMGLALSLTVVGVWLFAGPWLAPKADRWDVPMANACLEVGAVSVGDGSCLYVRSWDVNGRPEGVLVFDAGSQSLGRTGKRTIAPCFAALGIKRIDTLVISHPDLDHFGAVPDLAGEIPIGRILVTQYMVDQASAQPQGSEAVLFKAMTGAGSKDVPTETIKRGDQVTVPGVTGEVLWPSAGLKGWRTNDVSVVMRIAAGGRTVLLSGDIQNRGIAALEALNEKLAADIAEMPHHGGFVEKSGQWLVDVSPRILVQSSGMGRLEDDDRWPTYLKMTGAKRLVTGRDGFVRVWVAQNGLITTQTFLSPDVVRLDEMELE